MFYGLRLLGSRNQDFLLILGLVLSCWIPQLCGDIGSAVRVPPMVLLGEREKRKAAALALQLGHAGLRLHAYADILASPLVRPSHLHVSAASLSDFAHSSRAQRAPPPSLRKSVLGSIPSRSLSASPLITPPRRPRTQVRRCGLRRRGGTFVKDGPLASPTPPLLVPALKRCLSHLSD